MLRNHGILFEERPARRHSKIGIVESGHNRISLVRPKTLEGRGVESLELWPVYPEAGDSVESYVLV